MGTTPFQSSIVMRMLTIWSFSMKVSRLHISLRGGQKGGGGVAAGGSGEVER